MPRNILNIFVFLVVFVHCVHFVGVGKPIKSMFTVQPEVKEIGKKNHIKEVQVIIIKSMFTVQPDVKEIGKTSII